MTQGCLLLGASCSLKRWVATLTKGQSPVPAPFSGLTLPLCAVWSEGRHKEEQVCPPQALPESSNKMDPPLGTAAHPVVSLLAWPAHPLLSTPVALFGHTPSTLMALLLALAPAACI